MDLPAQEKADAAEVLDDEEDARSDAIKEKAEKETTKQQPLSKNAMKKLARLERLKCSKMERRRRERENRKRRRREEGKTPTQEEEARLSKRDRRKLEVEQLRQGLSSGLRVVVHLNYGEMMSDRELCSLASQVGRAYGANRSASNGKVALWLVGMDERTRRSVKSLCEY